MKAKRKTAPGQATPATPATKASNATAAFERALARPDRRQYVLRLYVTGMTPRSIRAVANLKKICEEHLKGRYDLQVIDIYQQPKLAEGDQIIAVPTLIKKLPTPLRRMIGDLSDSERVLLGLDLQANSGRELANHDGQAIRP